MFLKSFVRFIYSSVKMASFNTVWTENTTGADVIIILHFLNYQIRGKIFWRACEVVKNAKKALKEPAGPLILVASTPRELPRSL